ncbi:MAG: terminase small subunit [Methylococcales bacterium]|nr:terminase small subunit [Methylococcales bacterium]
MALTRKQQAFVDEYLIDLNGRQAATRAGYILAKSESTPCRLLKNPAIQAAIASGMATRMQRVKIDQDRVLLEIARLAFCDPRRLFDANGALLPIQDWPEDMAAAVASIRVQEVKNTNGVVIGTTKLVKFWDKGKQLELAARHLGLLHEKLEITTSVSHLIRAGRERIRLTDEDVEEGRVIDQVGAVEGEL